MASSVTEERIGPRERRAILPLLLGVAVGLGVIVAANTNLKIGGAVFGGLLGLALLMLVESRRVFLGAMMLFFIPLALDVNFFYRNNGGSTGGLVISAADLCLFALAAIWLKDIITGRRVARVDRRIFYPALAYLIIAALSLLSTNHLDLSLFELFRLAKATLILVVLPNVIRDERDLKFALVIIFLTLAAESVLVFVQRITGSNVGLMAFGESRRLMVQMQGFYLEPRPAGTLLHPNMMAIYINLVLFMGIAFLLALKPSWKLLPVAVAVGMGFLALLFTLSRGGWVCFAVGYLAMAAFLFVYKPRRRQLVVWLTILAVVLAVAAVSVPTLVRTRLYSEDYRAAYLRIPLAKIALGIISKSPVLGIGLNTYPQEVVLFLHNEMPTTLPTWYFLDNLIVHNLFLLIAAEIGVIGMVAFLWFVGAATWKGFRLARQQMDWLGLMSLGISCSIIAFLVAELFDNSFRVGISLPYLIYTEVALMLTVQKLRAAKRARQQEQPATADSTPNSPPTVLAGPHS